MHIAYTRSHDGAEMIEIAPGIAVNRDYFIAAAPVAPKAKPKAPTVTVTLVEPVRFAVKAASTVVSDRGSPVLEVDVSISARPLRVTSAEIPSSDAEKIIAGPLDTLSKPLAKAARYYAGIGRRHAAIAKELGCTVEAVRKAIAS